MSTTDPFGADSYGLGVSLVGVGVGGVAEGVVVIAFKLLLHRG